MTAPRNAVHASFVVERALAAPLARVWAAWADPAAKRRWSDCHADGPGNAYSLDFREGGEELHRVTRADGAVQVVSKRFLDLAPERRIVFAYDIVVDGSRLSASLVTVEFAGTPTGAHMTYTEQVAYFDGHDDLQQRIEGTREGIERLALAVEEAEPA